MSKSLFILGRQPALGAAELESLYGHEKLKVIDNGAAILDSESGEINFNRIGGSIKLCRTLAILPFNDWRKITDYLVEQIPKHFSGNESGKLTFGISTYGVKTNSKQINATALSIKKSIKNSGRPVRVVPNKSNELNSAQVLHNKLTKTPLGIELVVVKDGASTFLAQTVEVQDIEAYGARDQARPKRDAKVGMLPPKLAQIIVNLAVGRIIPAPKDLVYDPFCGTGVILQEAILMGFNVAGSDLDPRMVNYTEENLQWLHTLSQNQVSSDSNDNKQHELAVADATQADFPAYSMSFIACETYLGRPFSALPNPEVLNEVIRDLDTIHKKFLQNVARQTRPGFRMCIAVPAWKTKFGFKHLHTLDSLEELGYTRLKFVHAGWEDMIYHREGQIVGRELVVLKRI